MIDLPTRTQWKRDAEMPSDSPYIKKLDERILTLLAELEATEGRVQILREALEVTRHRIGLVGDASSDRIWLKKVKDALLQQTGES